MYMYYSRKLHSFINSSTLADPFLNKLAHFETSSWATVKRVDFSWPASKQVNFTK